MQKRITIISVTTVLVIGVIIGSFFDLQINGALFSNRNPFGIFMSAFGMIPGYAFIAFMGGVLFNDALNKKHPLWLRIIFYILSFAAIGIAAYFSGNEFFSINGYNVEGTGMLLLAIGIMVIFHSGVLYIGFRLAKKSTNEKMWIVVLILVLGLILALVATITPIKSIFHRPRYRIVQLGIPGLEYHEWWEVFKDYKLFVTPEITKEEFKSFPSGHAGASMLVPFFIIFIAQFSNIVKKYEIPLIVFGFLYTGLVMFSRMLVGAHYLSDVCFGGLITIMFMSISYFVINKIKLLH